MCAPMDGTFWQRPAPDKPAFVVEGSSFKKGDTLGLIEVMKTFSPIKARNAGKVVAIHSEDGQGVAEAQVLIRVLYSQTCV